MVWCLVGYAKLNNILHYIIFILESLQTMYSWKCVFDSEENVNGMTVWRSSRVLLASRSRQMWVENNQVAERRAGFLLSLHIAELSLSCASFSQLDRFQMLSPLINIP